MAEDLSNKILYEYAANLCEMGGEEDGVLEEFWGKITRYPEVMKEFDYYRINNDFLGELSVCGITVADILIWQIDRFKAALDEGKFALKCNGPHMVLGAFYTMCDVCDNPGKYTIRFSSETGTDYPGKNSCCDYL